MSISHMAFIMAMVHFDENWKFISSIFGGDDVQISSQLKIFGVIKIGKLSSFMFSNENTFYEAI